MFRAGMDALLREQEGMDVINRETIRAMQLAKLNRLLLAEKEKQGFYRDLPEHLESLEELADLPFTTDEDLAANAPGLLMMSQSRIERVLSDATSGTTGSAKRVFYSEQDCENTIRLFMAGLGELVFPGSVTMICMPFSGPHGLGELISEAILRLGAKPLKVGCSCSFEELRQWMENEKPETFVGMPVPLLSMLRVLGKGSLQRALISADACPESLVRSCEEILGSRLFPHYGSREMGLGGAITCQAHAGMHLRENNVIAEIIDENGRPLPDGETGELVITTIGMEAMPLIRYRTGDFTRILPGICPCGSSVIRLDRVHRRAAVSPEAGRAGAEKPEAVSHGAGRPGGMEDLDEIIFAHQETADYRASRREDAYQIELRTVPAADVRQVGEEIGSRLTKQFPRCSFTVESRSAQPEDTAMYPGKRVITDRR